MRHWVAEAAPELDHLHADAAWDGATSSRKYSICRFASTQGTDHVFTLRYKQGHAPLAGQRGAWAVQKAGSL